MTLKPRVLAVGNSHVALDMQVECIPLNGRSTKGKSYNRFPGGSGINTAVALSRFGVDCILSSRVGSDSNAARIIQFLSSARVDTRFVENDSIAATGLNVILTEPDKRSRRIIFDGANSNLSVVDIEDAFNSYPDAVIINADIPKEAATAAVAFAARNDTPTLLSVIGDYVVPPIPEYLKRVEILVIDPKNIEYYTGFNPDNVDLSLKACMSLASRVRSHYYLLRLGSRGTFIYDGKYYIVVPAVDTGATDSGASAEFYNSAMFIRYLVSSDIKLSCEYAAASELCAQLRQGGAAMLPGTDDIEKLIKDNNLSERLIF